MKPKTQKEVVKGYLEMYGSISSWTAINQFHITRLASIIYRLRKSGMLISSEKQERGNKNYVIYKLVS